MHNNQLNQQISNEKLKQTSITQRDKDLVTKWKTFEIPFKGKTTPG